MSTAEVAARGPGRPANDPGQAVAVGARIRDRRVSLGLYQAELARAIRVGRSAVCEWESGEKTPSVGHVPALCRALGIDPNQLFGWEASH